MLKGRTPGRGECCCFCCFWPCSRLLSFATGIRASARAPNPPPSALSFPAATPGPDAGLNTAAMSDEQPRSAVSDFSTFGSRMFRVVLLPRRLSPIPALDSVRPGPCCGVTRWRDAGTGSCPRPRAQVYAAALCARSCSPFVVPQPLRRAAGATSVPQTGQHQEVSDVGVT